MRTVEVVGSASGMAGALLLATQYPPGLGFAAFLLSNFAWLIFSRKGRHWGLFVQQLVFLVASLIGLWNWWLGPLLSA